VAPITLSSHSLHAQGSTIQAAQIASYVELSAVVSELEAPQKTLGAQLLGLHKAELEQETASPSILAFVNQERHTTRTNTQRISLAVRIYGTDKLTGWNTRLGHSATVQAVTEIRINPNRTVGTGKRPRLNPFP
jgi:hypothetical protein